MKFANEDERMATAQILFIRGISPNAVHELTGVSEGDLFVQRAHLIVEAAQREPYATVCKRYRCSTSDITRARKALAK